MKTKLKTKQVKACLQHYPSITTLEEMCAILNIDIKALPKADFDNATWLIERNRLRTVVALKEKLRASSKTEQLYKMICDESELKRWGVKIGDQTTVNTGHTIEIKSADPDIIDKIKEL